MFKKTMLLSTAIAVFVSFQANAKDVPVAGAPEVAEAVAQPVPNEAAPVAAEEKSAEGEVKKQTSENGELDDELAGKDELKPADNEEHTPNSVYVCSGRSKLPVFYSKDDYEKEFMNFEIVYDFASGAYQKTMENAMGKVIQTGVRSSFHHSKEQAHEIKVVLNPVTEDMTVVTIGKEDLKFKEEHFTEHMSGVDIPSVVMEGKCRRINVDNPDS